MLKLNVVASRVIRDDVLVDGVLLMGVAVHLWRKTRLNTDDRRLLRLSSILAGIDSREELDVVLVMNGVEVGLRIIFHGGGLGGDLNIAVLVSRVSRTMLLSGIMLSRLGSMNNTMLMSGVEDRVG